MTIRKPYFDPERDREEAATRAEQFDQLHAALDQLCDFDKTIVRLRYFEQLSNRATAEKLGLTDQAASMRYLRAMRRLRKLASANPNKV